MDDELTPRTARRVRFKLETQNTSTESDPLIPKVQPVIKHEQSAIVHEPTNPRCKIAPPSSKLLDYWVEKIAYLLSAFPIFDPHSRFRLLWNVIVFISIFYNCFAIPARIAFRDLWSHQDLYKFYVMDYICDFIYLFDLILNFRTEYNDRGVIVDDPHLVVKHYLKGWFVYDFISVLPLDLFYWRPLEHAFLRVNRMLKLGRSNYYFHLWQFHTKHLHLVLFAKFLAYFLILDQWMACLYVALSYQEKFENDYIVPDTYVDQGFVEKYFYSFYWSTTVLVDVGAEGDHVFTQLEIYFTLFMAYLVLFIGAGITATVVDIVRNLRKQRVQFKNRLALINEFLESKEIPHHLQKSIKHYYFYIWSKQKGVDENEILEQLPRKLRTEVSLFMNGSIIKKVPLFKKANQGFICELVDYLSSEIYSPGEFIVKKGEVNSNMFFIHEGALEVVGSSGECCSMLGEGGHFGEIGLLSESTSQVSVRAVTHCDVYVLNKIDLEKVLNCFPEQKEIFMRTAIVRATRDSLIKHARDLLMFSKVSHSFLRDFVDSFHSVTVESGEFLYKCDEAPERMYYFSKGRIELIDSLDKVTNVLELGQSIEEGCLLGHINLALGMKQFVGAKTSNKSNKCILLAIESAKFKSLLKNYPEDAEKVMRGAECHRDRACAIFGRPSAFSRPAKVLWRLALLRLRGMRLWHQSLKVKMNREWLETTKVLENELQTNNMNSSQIEKSLMLLNQCEAKLIKSFSSRTNTQEKKIVMLKDLKQFS